jgi:hypothetical protein
MTAQTLRFTWLAGRDRVAHASVRGQIRTLCGERVVDERFAWPKIRNCMGCTSLVAEREGRLALPDAPIAENEFRALSGDR